MVTQTRLSFYVIVHCLSCRMYLTQMMIKEEVEQKRNVMAHAQKPDLVFQRHGRVRLYRRGCQFSRLLAAEVCASAVVILDRPCPIQCTTAGYPLHSPFPPSLLHPCVSVCHHIPFLLYSHVTKTCTLSKLVLLGPWPQMQPWHCNKNKYRPTSPSGNRATSIQSIFQLTQLRSGLQRL